MKNQMKNPLFAHDKDTHFQAQKQIVFSYLLTHTSTMKMVEVATGIDRANICRFFAEFRKENSIYTGRPGICGITKFRAIYYTTRSHCSVIENIKLLRGLIND